jgi:hypothetical protein
VSVDYSQGVHDLVCKEQKSLYGLNQSPRAWFGKFCKVIQQFGMIHSETGHSAFFKCSYLNKVIYLVIYADDIVITDNDQEGIKDLKQHLFSHTQTKDIGRLRYLLGIVAQPQEGLFFRENTFSVSLKRQDA